MNEKEKRYPIAVYLVVLSIGVVFAFIGFMLKMADKTDSTRSILLNLATELVGATVIFFLVNHFFLMEEAEISKRISELIPIAGWGTIYSNFSETDITSQLANASKVDICFMQTYLPQIMDAHLRDSWREMIQLSLTKGCSLRVILLDTNKDDYITNRSLQIGEDSARFKQLMEQTRAYFDACKNAGSNVEIKTCTGYPIGPVFKIGDFLYQGFYLTHRNALECPVIKINLKSAGPLKGFEQALDRAWKNAV